MLCPACSQSELDVFFDAGEVPVFANVLHDSADAARSAPRGRIRLGGCRTCDFVHNVDFDERLVAYAPGYENSLHGSPTFQAFASELATGLVERHGLADGRAIEIGGGRGEFMRMLLDAGLTNGLVMDPSAPDDAVANEARFVLERRLFEASDAATADTKLLLTRHVLEHLGDPAAFIGLLAGAAGSAGAGLYVEVPNGLWTLRDLGVWDVIYEHCSYFTPRALSELMARHGADCAPTESYGGQFLGADATSITEGTSTASAEAIEPSEGHWAGFGNAHAERAETWRGRVAAARAEGRRLAIWGAGSKGTTFLNTIDSDGAIVCAVDVNQRKLGRFIAGTGHEIVAPSQLASLGIDGIIVMNPMYAEEIAAMANDAGVQAEVSVV